MESEFHTKQIIFTARFTRIIKIYAFILTPGRRTGEILVEQTDGKNDPSDQSNPRCACAPRVKNSLMVSLMVQLDL